MQTCLRPAFLTCWWLEWRKSWKIPSNDNISWLELDSDGLMLLLKQDKTQALWPSVSHTCRTSIKRVLIALTNFCQVSCMHYMKEFILKPVAQTYYYIDCCPVAQVFFFFPQPLQLVWVYLRLCTFTQLWNYKFAHQGWIAARTAYLHTKENKARPKQTGE